MVKVASCGFAAAIGFFVLAGGASYADQAQVYKLVVHGKVVQYGTEQNGSFIGCNGLKMEKPPDATLVPAGGPCPSDDDTSFAPQSGHIPKESPKPKPKHT